MVGFIPAKSKWGKYLAQKGRENHPYYRHARFRTVAETKSILTEQDFQVIEAWSTLFQSPASTLEHEHPVHYESEEAGFCVLTAIKQGVQGENC